jgi:hypothetical protein
MNDMERAKLQDEINAVFRDGSILTAKEDKLQEYLMSLASEHVPNDMVRHRETIRALTINHVQMQRHIDKLNKQNTILQYLVIALTIASLIGTAVQTYKILQSPAQSTSTAAGTVSQPTATGQPMHIIEDTKANIPFQRPSLSSPKKNENKK